LEPADIKDTIGNYVGIFTVLTSVAVVCLPALGLVMDRLGTASGAVMVAVLNLLYAGSALLPGIDVQILTFVLYAIGTLLFVRYDLPESMSSHSPRVSAT